MSKTLKVQGRRVILKRELESVAPTIQVEAVAYQLHKLIDRWAEEAYKNRPERLVEYPTITWSFPEDFEHYSFVEINSLIEVKED